MLLLCGEVGFIFHEKVHLFRCSFAIDDAVGGCGSSGDARLTSCFIRDISILISHRIVCVLASFAIQRISFGTRYMSLLVEEGGYED